MYFTKQRRKMKLINLGIFFTCCLICEILFFVFSYQKGLPLIFILDWLIFIGLGSVVFFFRHCLFDKIYMPIILLLVSACYCLNALFYRGSQDVFVLENLFHLDTVFQQAIDHSDSFSWPILISFIVTYVVSVVAFFILNYIFDPDILDNGKEKHKHTFGTVLLLSSLSIYSLGLGITSVVERNNGNYTIDAISSNARFNASSLGLLTFYVKNLGQMIFKSNYYDISDMKNYFTDASYVHDDYTGLLKDYNVVVITIETGGDYMLNEYTTPNLYRLLQDGINCNHNYIKNRTFYSEMLGIAGNTLLDCLKQEVNYTLPYTLPNLLNNYQSIYCLDVDESNDIFKQRSLMPQLGFKQCLYHEDLAPDKEPFVYADSNFIRDSEIMGAITNKLDTLSSPFYLHYTSMCMHDKYDDNSKRDKSMMDDIKAEFDNRLANFEQEGKWENPAHKEKNRKKYRNYALCTMDFDKALGMLLDDLSSHNKLDNTLLVLYGDHDIMGGGGTIISRDIKGTNNADEIANYSTILGFYNPKLNELYHQKNNTNLYGRFSTPSSIVPTVLDLLGIKYNPKFYQGKSLFDPNYNVEVLYSLSLHEFMNEQYLSVFGNIVDKVFDNNNSKKQFLNRCQEFVKQEKYLDIIYRNNIFAHYDYQDFMPKNNV